MLLKEQGNWEMTQLMKYLPQKHEDQSSDPHTLTEVWNICDGSTEE